MGTSYTEYGTLGFWARDDTVEEFLRLLSAAVEASPAPAPWLGDARQDWIAQATAGFQGCVDVGLNRHLAADPDREAAFLDLLNEARDRITTADTTTGGGAPFGNEDGEGSPACADVLLRFTTAVAGLVRGDIAWDTHRGIPGVWASTTAGTPSTTRQGERPSPSRREPPA